MKRHTEYRDRFGRLHVVKGPAMTQATKDRLAARAEVERWHRRWCRLWARVGVESVRPLARDRIATAVILDHTSQGSRWMLDVALQDYKLRFPEARGERAIVSRPVNLATLPDRLRGLRNYEGLADYHCRYCGARLHTGNKGMIWGGRESPMQHAARCALESLAGLRIPVPPGHNPLDPATLQLAVEQLASIARAAVLAWASDVVDDTMRRFSLLELS